MPTIGRMTTFGADGPAKLAGARPPAPKLLAIVELPVKDFTDQCGTDLRSNALEPGEILYLLRIGMRR